MKHQKTTDTREFIRFVLAGKGDWRKRAPTKCRYRFEDLQRWGSKSRLIFLNIYYRNRIRFDLDYYTANPSVFLPLRLNIHETDPLRTWLSMDQMNELLFAATLNPNLHLHATNFLTKYKVLLKKIHTQIGRYAKLQKTLKTN